MAVVKLTTASNLLVITSSMSWKKRAVCFLSYPGNVQKKSRNGIGYAFVRRSAVCENYTVYCENWLTISKKWCMCECVCQRERERGRERKREYLVSLLWFKVMYLGIGLERGTIVMYTCDGSFHLSTRSHSWAEHTSGCVSEDISRKD